MPVTPPDPRAAAAPAVASLHNVWAYPAGPGAAGQYPGRRRSRQGERRCRGAVFQASGRRSVVRWAALAGKAACIAASREPA